MFQIDGGVTASLSGLTISGGLATGHNGGGLLNYGTARLTDCTLSGNYAYAQDANPHDYTLVGGYGGGLDNLGTANLTGCTISGNSAVHGSGGGLDNSGTANLTDCTLSGNYAPTAPAWTIPARPAWPTARSPATSPAPTAAALKAAARLR